MPVNMSAQLESNWCWAAVAVAVNCLFSPESTVQQCGVAQPVLTTEERIGPAVDCCANPDLCNIPAFLQDALTVVGNLKKVEHGFLAFAGVTAELDAGRPVGVRIQWSDGGGHFLLIDGYRVFTSGAQQVHVADPYYGPSYVLYGNFVNSYQDDGVWTDTFFLQS